VVQQTFDTAAPLIFLGDKHMQKIYHDAFGNEVIVDDEISLLGPNPLGGQSPEAVVLQQQPVKFWRDGKLVDTNDLHYKPPMLSGYGVTQEALDEYLHHNKR
jgi:hypothetical protein